ncbi:MAG: rhomboid family intramembrane serine protease [Candidatus Hydrogenedentota bacterium]
MLIPLSVDVPMYRTPISNIVIVAVTVFYSLGGFANPESVEEAMLHGSSPGGLFSYMLFHGSLMHLLGNMIFLWVFGNAVCAKVGNGTYILIYIAAGIAGGMAHLVLDGAPTIGASGAVNGIVGMYLIFYPLNNITCFYLIVIPIPPFCGTVSLSSMWIILLWLVFDIWGVIGGGGPVAYWAHLGGFATGFGIGALLLLTGGIPMSDTECSLPDVLRGKAPH